MPWAEFWTLSEVFPWFVTILTNTHLVKQLSIRLPAEIGFSEIHIFKAPTPISEPWFWMLEAEFWTLSEVLAWFVTISTNTHRAEQLSTRFASRDWIFGNSRFWSSNADFWTMIFDVRGGILNLEWSFVMVCDDLTNTHRVEQHSTCLRVEIGFSEILVFGAPTPISEPSPPPENRWSEGKTGPKWSQIFTTKPSGPLCSLRTEPVVSGASYLACRRASNWTSGFLWF